MTRKQLIECDWNWTVDCDESIPHYVDDVPNDWSVFHDGDNERHLCPHHTHKARRLLFGGVSEGADFDVEHQIEPNVEAVRVNGPDAHEVKIAFADLFIVEIDGVPYAITEEGLIDRSEYDG